MTKGNAIVNSLKTGWAWLVVGVVLGTLIPATRILQFLPTGGSVPGEQADAPAEDDHDDIVALSDTARWNLGLRTGRVKVKPFTRTIDIPGTVRERPGLSNLAVSSRVHAVVTHILARPGQAVRVGQPLFRMRLTGDELATAQSSLLDTVQQTARVESQIKLLENAARAGGVAANRLRDLKFDYERLQLSLRNRRQELVVRGLTEKQVDDIVSSKSFLREVTVGMHEMVDYAADAAQTEVSSQPSFDDGLNFTVEELQVHPGMAVEPGQELCQVAYHTSLYFEGQAFEKDLELLRTVTQDDKAVAVAFGTERRQTIEPNLQVIHIDNHIDTESQTFRFYVPIRNQVLGDTGTGDVIFRSWRFKPGQRGHVQIPAETISGHFTLPREAVVIEGPYAFVFREIKHDHSDEAADGHDHADEREFEPVAVQVLFKSQETAVVSSGQKLKVGERIAMNRAYDLQLALKSGEGSAHSHDHEH